LAIYDFGSGRLRLLYVFQGRADTLIKMEAEIKIAGCVESPDRQRKAVRLARQGTSNEMETTKATKSFRNKLA
jgi:hypothetical protein